ncbi:hypothetical protein TIFTF001_007702 [Ficus carica]|uniref:Uncharacterized protein n=1 Tax=Ficus carica TaxID=3494 RepID=A0AA88A745_FICCA|nr:hypothetical protein TIFTF001_007702 [Ficus carica]
MGSSGGGNSGGVGVDGLHTKEACDGSLMLANGGGMW